MDCGEFIVEFVVSFLHAESVGQPLDLHAF